MQFLCECTVRCSSCNSLVEDTTNFFYAVEILMQLEKAYGISVAGETVEVIRPWSELTLQDLATAAERSSGWLNSVCACEAVYTAVRKEFPNAPESLDFTVPLRDALGSP
jgi:hypothetical protein